MKNFKHILSFSVIVVFIMLFIASASASGVYKPPMKNNSENQFSKIINKPFDEVWDRLISYSAGTFFGIENFEKESGLLTLSFGASNPEEYITGGYWKVDIKVLAQKRNFEGDYVKYLSSYNKGQLIGKMNIVVVKIDSAKTKVVVNARYIFSDDTTTWSFNSGSCAEVMVANPANGTPPTRTICPTYKAENAILDALE